MKQAIFRKRSLSTAKKRNLLTLYNATQIMNGSIVLSDKRVQAQWKGKCEEMVLPSLNFCDNGLQMQLRPTLQMQKLLGAVFNPKQLIDTYLSFRQLLGNDVRRSHEAWVQLQATNDHPLLKVTGLAFGVISTPETSSYMEQQWNQLQEHVGQNRPDAIMARAMMDYARAWAY